MYAVSLIKLFKGEERERVRDQPEYIIILSDISLFQRTAKLVLCVVWFPFHTKIPSHATRHINEVMDE